MGALRSSLLCLELGPAKAVVVLVGSWAREEAYISGGVRGKRPVLLSEE